MSRLMAQSDIVEITGCTQQAAQVFSCCPSRYRPRTWCASSFEWHWVADQVDGVLYAGLTVFGHSILYTDY